MVKNRKEIVEKRGTYYGFDYFIKFMEPGYRCGYVRVPENNYNFGLNYNEIDVDCHGGLTFSKMIEKENNGFFPGYWIGFDCHHDYDKCDIELSKEIFGDSEVLKFYEPFNCDGDIRKFDYVEKECFHIIDQIS